MNPTKASIAATEKRFASKLGPRSPLSATPYGRRRVDLFFAPLAKIIAGKLEDKRHLPRGDLGKLLRQLDSEILALLALPPVLHAVGVRCRNLHTREARLKIEIGRGFYTHVALADLGGKAKARMSQKLADNRQRAIWFITKDKTDKDCLRAGDWLLECVKELDAFDYVESVAIKDRNGFDRVGGHLVVVPEWQEQVDRLREECIWNDPVLQPLLEPPLPWTSLHRYIGPLRTTFIKNLSPKERKTIAEDFRTGVIAEHARGVSALEQVALSIDEEILDLVQRHAVDVIGHKGEQREADETMVKDDVTVARMYAGKKFHLSYTCDRRGRIYADQYLNFARQDHVRALFRFAKGDKLGADNIQWLQIHLANCHGETAKKPYRARVQWCLVHHDLIQRVAADPDNTIAECRKVDEPFAFIAACKELVGAYRDPDNFTTHLPIRLDGTANAIQNSALILRDENAAKLANITPSDHPQDVYREVVERVLTDLRIEATEPADCALADLIDRACFADWWLRRLDLLKDRQKRGLLKTPGMAMGYGITDFGMAEAICDEYRELFELNEPTEKAAFFLAERIRRACREVLPRVDELMTYVRAIAERCASLGIVMEWVSPTGIRFSSLYETPNIKRVYLPSGAEHRIASGSGTPDPDKAANAATANLIHSLDSAHLVRVINAMAARGMGLLPVHDCYGFLASNAVLVNQIIRQQWCWMYEEYDVLGLLHRWNADGANSISPPPLGNLNLRESVGWSPYCVM